MIISLQRRLAEVGRIRIGQQVPTGNGRTRPEKLATFRLTSADRARIDHAAHLYGGEVRQWDAPAGPQWEVVTGTDVLEVIVPPSDMGFSQHLELWSAGGCTRRCDGRTEQITQGPCLCDPDARECSIHTRLSVMLRDLPGLGVWRIDTSGYYAATELQGAVQVIQVAAGHGRMLPARLRLEQRMVKRIIGGKSQTRRFAVPVLDVGITAGELMAPTTVRQAGIASGELSPPSSVRQMAVDPTTGELHQLGGTPAHLTPVPALTTGTLSVGEQVADAARQEPRAGRATPIPPTGLRPRTAAEAEADVPAGDAITHAQLAKIGAAMREIGMTDRSEALAFVTDAVGREIRSRNDLTKSEASRVIDALGQWGAAEPPNAPPTDGTDPWTETKP